MGLPARAVEFPLARRSNDADIHTINVAEAGFGESIYDFRLATVAGSTRAAQAHGPIALSCVQDDSREFIWRLESAEPCVLALHDVCLVAGGNHDNEVRLEFPIPLLPSICGVATAEGHRVFSIAADGSLVVVSLAHEPTAQEIRPLHHRLSAEGSVTTVSLAETFERVGTPTTLLLAAETLCIGTASGTILCLPAMDPNPATAMELTASSGLFSSLTGALGGLLGKPKAQPVEQLAELHCMGRPFLCSIHAGSVVRVWDLESRRMLHSAELLPPQEGAAYKATLARSTGKATSKLKG